MKFRFGTSLQSDVEFFSVCNYFLHDRSHLVDLNRVDDVILRIVTVFFGGNFKTACHFLDSAVEDIWKTKQNRCRNIS